MYAVTVTVTDDDGASTSDSLSMTANNVSPLAAIGGAPTSSPEGTEISLSCTVVDPGTADTPSYAWSVTKNGSAYASGSAEGFEFKPDDNGTYVVTLTVTDDDGGSGSDSRSIAVTNVAPVPTNDGPKVAKQYSDFIVPVTVSASDTGSADTLSASIVSGLPPDSGLSLSWDESTNTGVLSGKANLAPGPFNIVVRVTDDDGGFADTTIVLTVIAEDAASEYTGIAYVTTNSTRTSEATITLRAAVCDASALAATDPEYDQNAGDIGTATVKFEIYDDSMNLLKVVAAGTPILSDPSNTKVGSVAVNWTANIGSSDAQTYLILVVTEGRYADTGDFYTLTVSKPFDNAILGGGYVVNQNSSGSLSGDPGQRTNFGFNVRYNKRKPQGKVTMIIRRLETDGILHTYLVKSNAITSMGTDKRTGTGTFEAKCSVLDITNPLSPISIAGNVAMQIRVMDRGEPGTADTIAATLWASNGALMFSNNWDGAVTREQLLERGNLQVR